MRKYFFHPKEVSIQGRLPRIRLTVRIRIEYRTPGASTIPKRETDESETFARKCVQFLLFSIAGFLWKRLRLSDSFYIIESTGKRIMFKTDESRDMM